MGKKLAQHDELRDESDITSRLNLELIDKELNKIDSQPHVSNTEMLMIGITLIHMNVQIVVRLADAIILGRSYPQIRLYDGVDFSPFGAYLLGVSHKHASLKKKESHLFITDNDSIRGTFVNNQRLPSGNSVLLANKDIVQLGKLMLMIEILPR